MNTRFVREFASLALADAVPVFGVLLLGWDAHAAMFLLSWEVIVTSAVLAWLFNYPERSTAAGRALAVLLSPTGLLMWAVLERTYDEASFGVMVGELFAQTWVSMVLIALYAIVSCGHAMADARERGARVEVNDRILLRWLFSVFLPFAVFAGVIGGWKSMGAWSLAAVLTAKTIVDLAFAWRRQGRQLAPG